MRLLVYETRVLYGRNPNFPPTLCAVRVSIEAATTLPQNILAVYVKYIDKKSCQYVDHPQFYMVNNPLSLLEIIEDTVCKLHKRYTSHYQHREYRCV